MIGHVLWALSVGAMEAPPPDRAARRVAFAEAAVFDAVGGGSRPRTWVGHVYGGYPWLGARGQVGVGPRGLAVGVDVEAARLRRFRPAALLAMRWVDRARVRMSGELLLGYLVQIGELGRKGANVELRVRLAFPTGRAAPYVMLGTSHTLLADRTMVITASGETRALSFRHEWMPRATIGVAVAITRAIGLELGVDLAWYEAPSRTPSIPGFHLGLVFGGGRR